MKRILFFFLGLIAWLSLLCSIAVACVNNQALMTQGFLQFSQTAHLNVPASRYGEYAGAICGYLDGKTTVTQIKDAETGELVNAFSDKENAHLADVRGIVSGLKMFRYVGGGAVIAALALLYFLRKQERPRMLSDAVRGFALSALFLLFAASALAMWGIVNFDGLFITFHKIAFTNDLWLLNPNTDVLMALMPLPFFTWYVGEMVKSLLPVLIMMALVIVAWGRMGKSSKF
ncbi:MAG: DUF1461 domain-containing protein [Clostridia bacterium]|nr:DUF1461 domain-containing protein [Clostridia bacterium]MBR0409134.1 DUF1461 domain-containing protein [Clostridia bacterium]